MKKFISYVAVTCVFGGIESAQAVLTCDPVPQNVGDAKVCMQGFLGKTAEIQEALDTKKHLGDMQNCKGTQENVLPSYFAKDVSNALKNVTMGECEEAEGEYKCFVNLHQNACFITKNGTRSKTKAAIMRVEKANGKLIDFYPIKKQ